MARRVSKAELPPELKENMIKQLGAVPENVEVLWHSPKVTQDNLEFGGKVAAWDAADASLKSFAHMAVAAQVGCSWCLDVGYFQAQNENLDRCSGRRPTRKTCCRSPGCGGPTPTTRRCVTRGRTSSAPGRRV